MTDIKSQDDLNQPETHSTEVLLEAISKLETTTKELERTKKQNLLLKIANAELRDQLDTIYTRIEKAFYDDNTSFWDALVDIRKTLKKDSTNGKE